MRQRELGTVLVVVAQRTAATVRAAAGHGAAGVRTVAVQDMQCVRRAVVIVYVAIIVVVQVLQNAVGILQRVRQLQVDVTRIRIRVGVTRNWHRQHNRVLGTTIYTANTLRARSLCLLVPWWMCFFWRAREFWNHTCVTRLLKPVTEAMRSRSCPSGLLSI